MNTKVYFLIIALAISSATTAWQPTAIDVVTDDQSPVPFKVIVEGHLDILYNGTIYNVQGNRVK